MTKTAPLPTHSRLSEAINRLRLPLLFAGAAIGLLVATLGLLESRSALSQHLPDGNIARVGNTLIATERYTDLLDDLRADKRNPLNADDRKFALDRLIDEELLVQRGVELGFARNAPAVRKALTSAVISQVVTDASATLPGEATLREFHESAAPFFSTQRRLRLHWWRRNVDGDTSLPWAAEIHQRLIGSADPTALLEREDFEAVADLPDALLPANKLLDYIGPILLERASMLNPGEFSTPVHSGQSVHFLYLVEQRDESKPAFESVRDAVAEEYKYREGDKALREYLAWLRQRATVLTRDIDN